MSKSSQESSPTTQWTETITTILEDHFKHTLELRLDEDIPAATKALTSATIELIEGLIGPDEPAIYEASFGSSGGPSYAGIARNHLRQELRQSLKELT